MPVWKHIFFCRRVLPLQHIHPFMKTWIGAAKMWCSTKSAPHGAAKANRKARCGPLYNTYYTSVTSDVHCTEGDSQHLTPAADTVGPYYVYNIHVYIRCAAFAGIMGIASL
eukprot:jgi/Botrbrau1/21743/Bobra.43_1s0137.1